MGKSTPSAPDPVVTANAQAAANRNTAITQQQLNMVDQYNPYGSVVYNKTGNDFVEGTGVGTNKYLYNPATGEYQAYDAGSSPKPSIGMPGGSGGLGGILGGLKILGGTKAGAVPEGWQVVNGTVTPKYSQTTSLSPEQQAIFDQTQAAQTNLAGLANEQSGFLKEHLGKGFSFDNNDASQWAYDLASPRILQQQGQNEAELRSILANKGIREGSAAYNSEMSRLTNSNTDQLNQLALQGRGQAYNEAYQNYTTPINTITALMSGSQVGNPATASGATPQTSVGGVDYSGLVQQNYQNQLAASQSAMGGIGGLFGSVLGAAGQAGGFGALFGASDRRLKKNIERIGRTAGGHNVYSYNYIWGGPVQIGVMAQEVPHAAVMMPNGYLAVNYAEVR